ncbi:MAG: hypothetical protein Q9162_003965 [Coniocarpon cinnabarinum]
MPRSPGDSESQDRMRSVLRAIHENEGAPPSELALPPASPGPTSMAPPARRRARPSERFQRLNDQRTRRVQRIDGIDSDYIFNLHEASRRLARSNYDLRNLLDEPLHTGNEQNHSRASDGDDMIHNSESQHRRKRRRTEGPSRSKSPSLSPVDYGIDGQIKPSALDMEVRLNTETDSLNMGHGNDDGWGIICMERIKNILKDDSIAYTSRQRRTNIVLQHAGQRLFTMNRAVIKTPDRLEDDYVLQGLLFTSQEMDATFDLTAKLPIHQFPVSRFTSQFRNSAGGLRNYLSNIRSTGSSRDRPLDLPPLQDLDENPQNHLTPADCDAESIASDSDGSVDSRRGDNAAGTQATSPFHSESESESNFSPEEGAPSGLGAAERQEYTRSRLREGLWREANAARADDDDPFADNLHDDPDDVAAQFDFDEVLRRGAAVSADRRRRRAATRDRVQRQRLQRGSNSAAARSDVPPPPPGYSPTLHARSDAETQDDFSFQPPSLEPVEPPARPEDPRWLDPPRTLQSDPPPLQSGRHPFSVDPNELSVDQKFMEPAAFFSTSRRARLRYSANSRAHQQSVHPPDATERKDADAQDSATWQDASDGVIVSYKPQKYGGRVTIDFQAPISARYVLLKLWKSKRRSERGRREGESHENVRLSRVRIEGWCGTRYFPAIEFA